MLSHAGVAQQWTGVNTGLPVLLAPSIVSNAETLYVSVYGGGVYKSTDYGDNWTSINTGLNTLQVSAIELAPYVIAGTDSGVYIRVDDSTWGHFPTAGMANTLVRFLTLTPDSPSPRLNVGTPDGIFRQLVTQDWEAANNGLLGAALDIRSLTAYKSSTVNYGITGTADGVYMTFDNYATWQRKSNGLTGSSLRINKVLNLGSPAAIAATDSGLFATTDVGENWISVIPSETCMTTGGGNYPGTGLGIYVFGAKGFVTTNFSSWDEIDMSGTAGGLVLDFVTTQNYIFVTTQSGGVFRKALSDITAVDEQVSDVPHGFSLSQNYPNPFNPATRINYALPVSEHVRLSVYNMLGQEVVRVVDEVQEAGNKTVTFDAGELPSGMYTYRITAGTFTEVKKMVLMK